MLDSDNPLDDLPQTDFRSRDEWLAGKQVRCEDRMVRFLLSRLKASALAKDLRIKAKAVTGVDNLTFAMFSEEFSDFPVSMGARDIPYLHQLTFTDLWKRFTKTNIFVAYQNLQDELEHTDRPCALFFNWPQVGGLVLHNSRYSTDAGFRPTWCVGGKWLFLDTVGSWVDSVVRSYRGE